MNIARKVVIPIVIAATLLSGLAAALTFFVAVGDYHHYQSLAEQKRVSLPAFSAAFKACIPAAWLLLLLSAGFGCALLRREERQAVVVAWYCAGVAIVVGLWTAATFLALDLMHVCFYHFL